MTLATVVALPSPQPGGQAQAADPGAADTVFVNGRVMLFPKGDGPSSLMAPTLGWAQAVAVTDGLISYVGDDAGARRKIGPQTRVVDLGNKLLMPGIGDGHLHGGSSPQCDLDYEGGTIETVLSKLKACLLRADQAPHLTSNFRLSASGLMGDGLLPRGARLDRHVLDRLSKDPSEDPYGTGTTRPIVVRNMDGHKSYTNTKAIQNGGLDATTPDPPDGFIGRDPDGYPNGQFADFGANWGPSLPPAPDAAYVGKIADYKLVNSLGITSILHPGGSRSSLDLIKRVADDGHLTVRVNQALSAGAVRGENDPVALKSFVNGLNDIRDDFNGYHTPASPGTIEVDTVKIYCDGVPEFPGQTAAMLRPYMRNIGTTENPQWVPGDRRGEEPSCEDARRGFVALDADHWNIHVHSLGDRSTRVTLDNYEAAAKENATWDRRHTITHLEFIDAHDLRRFGQLGVVASMTGQWAQRDGWSVDGIEGYIEPDRMDNMYPSKDIIAGGGVVAQGSDWPVTRLVPWSAIEQFVTREGPADPARAIYPGALSGKRGIELAQAFRASTIGVAFQMHQDDVTGSIEVGKYADLIVADEDPFFIAGVSGDLASSRAKLASAEQALTTARADLATATPALAAAQDKRAGTTAKLRSAENARKKATARYKAARRAVKTAKAKSSGGRAVKHAKRRAARAKRSWSTARRNAKKARSAHASAGKLVAQADGKVTAARTAVTDADSVVGQTTAKIAALERAEAEGRERAIKRLSETQVLMTMLGGDVVYAPDSDPLGVTD